MWILNNLWYLIGVVFTITGTVGAWLLLPNVMIVFMIYQLLYAASAILNSVRHPTSLHISINAIGFVLVSIFL